MRTTKERLEVREQYLALFPKGLVNKQKRKLDKLREQIEAKKISYSTIGEWLNCSRVSVVSKIKFETDFTDLELQVLEMKLGG